MMNLLSLLCTPLPIFEQLWRLLESVSWLTPVSNDLFFNTSFLAIAIIPMIWFYFYGAWFAMIDFYSSEEFKYRHKVQNNIRITATQYLDAFYISLRNWLFLGIPYLYCICLLNQWLLSSEVLSPEPKSIFHSPKIPSLLIMFRDLAVYVLIEEVMFYFSHRILHWSSFYGPIHKFHHKFTAPCAIAAIYAHPIEHMLSNVIPVAMGPLLMRSHPITAMLWGILALFNTMTVHSGYDLSSPWLIFPAPYFHDWHHEKFNENFGATTLLDHLFGTNQNYLEAIRKNEMYVPRKTAKKAA